MTKIFRLHKDGTTANTGWFDSSKITTKQISSIISDGKKVATSIPSPFAQIDLVKSAFQWVSQNGIDGQTPHHKLVSDALDVGQLFFLSHLYKGLKIVEWGPKKGFKKLKESTDPKHNALGETLDIYFEQDKSVYNFDLIDKLYFVYYDGYLVGGTSPSTLFFASPDAEKLVSNSNISIVRGTDTLLDDVYASLVEREHDYIKYIYALSESKAFRDNLRKTGKDEFYNYLLACKSNLPAELRSEVDSYDADSINKFQQCPVTSSGSDFVSVIGIPLGLKDENIGSIKDESDFVITSAISDKKPLILPCDSFSPSWVFTTKDIKWNRDLMLNNVPKENKTTPSESRIPVQGDQYFWLSQDNFLTDTIVKLPYLIDKESFELCGSTQYLLPLKELFFEYFDAREIHKIVTVKEQASGGVEVKLEIPVKGGKVPFKKVYSTNNIINYEFYFSILPFIKVEQWKQKYTIGCIDVEYSERHRKNISFQFFKQGKRIQPSNKVNRIDGNETELTTYLSVPEYFDCIEISIDNKRSFVIPKMKVYQAKNFAFEYAIDFGTTNTHIEFKNQDSIINELSISKQEPIWKSLLDKNEPSNSRFIKEERHFETELFPNEINSSKIGFPTRTVLSENAKIDYNHHNELFKHVNNYFHFNDVNPNDNFSLQLNLKWRDYTDEIQRKRLELYIEFLINLTLLHSLLNNAQVDKTKIKWFYPVSMTSFQRGILKELWEEKFILIFGQFNNSNTIGNMPESIAPYYYYKYKQGVLGNSISIDIGGGTADIALFDENKPISISSFRFGANSIFGDSYGNTHEHNGYVNKFKDQAITYLQNSDISEKATILNTILSKYNSSADFSSYLFALKTKTKSDFDYAKLIMTDSNIKLGVLIYFTGISYYVAQHIKSTQDSFPENILFSGTGSKSLLLIDKSDGYKNITELIKYIGDQVGCTIPNKPFDTKLSDVSKEITAKGGLLNNEEHDVEYKYWIGTKENKLQGLHDSMRFNDISDTIKKEIIESNLHMFSIMDSFFDTYNISDMFGIKIEAYDEFKEKRELKLIEFLNEGIKLKMEKSNLKSSSPVEETLFFYPIIGLINRISYDLSKL